MHPLRMILNVCSVKVLLKAHLHTPQQSKSPHEYWLLLNEAALIQRALRHPAPSWTGEAATLTFGGGKRLALSCACVMIKTKQLINAGYTQLQEID